MTFRPLVGHFQVWVKEIKSSINILQMVKNSLIGKNVLNNKMR